MLLLEKSRSLLLSTLLIALSSQAMGQAQFAGTWRTKRSSLTAKHSITVNAAVDKGKSGGTVVLVNPDASEIRLEMVNAELRGDTLEFETKMQNETFNWWLRVEKGSRGAGCMAARGKC